MDELTELYLELGTNSTISLSMASVSTLPFSLLIIAFRFSTDISVPSVTIPKNASSRHHEVISLVTMQVYSIAISFLLL